MKENNHTPPKLIGISGKAGAGKDLTAYIILALIAGFSKKELKEGGIQGNLEALSGYTIEKFANPLKDMVCIILGCTREQLEDRVFKEKELGEEWLLYRTTSSYGAPDEINVESTGAFHESKEIPTPRRILQLLGTNCGRDIIHPNIWVNALFSKYKEESIYDPRSKTGGMGGSNWVITDMRFPNEMKAIQDRGGITIRINRNGLEKSDHASETALDDANFDYIINNNGTVTNLVEYVQEILTIEGLIS